MRVNLWLFLSFLCVASSANIGTSLREAKLKKFLLLCSAPLLFLTASLTALGQEHPGSIQYQMVHFTRTYPGCGPRGREQCLSVQVDYPAIVSAPTAAVQSLINTTIQQRLFQAEDGTPGPTSGDALAVELEQGYRDLQRRFPEYRTPWFDHRNAAVLLNNAAIFSVQMRTDQFTGGAHPNSYRVYLNFRPQTGEVLDLNAVLKQGAMAQLVAIAEKHFREARKLAPDADLQKAGFEFKDNRFALTENFGLTPDGMVLYYNNYDIAAYYFGPTEVKMPYPEIRDLLKLEFLPAQ